MKSFSVLFRTKGKTAHTLTVKSCFILSLGAWMLCSACSNEQPPMAPALQQRDSLPVMTTYGVSKLISDSGIIRYRIIAEEWKVYDKTNPPKHTFLKGIFMEKLDPKFQVDLTLTADTAYWYNQKLWELRGRVHIRKQNGTHFETEELFYDMEKHITYSHKYMRITTATQQLTGGFGFRSDENFTNYEFDNASGYFPKPTESMSADTVGQDGKSASEPTVQSEATEKTETRITPQKKLNNKSF